MRGHIALSSPSPGSRAIQNERFFALEPQWKLAISHPSGPSPQRGWSCVGAEKTSRLFSRGQASIDLTDARVRTLFTGYYIASLGSSALLMEDTGAF